jgi:hypothetical protein
MERTVISCADRYLDIIIMASRWDLSSAKVQIQTGS